MTMSRRDYVEIARIVENAIFNSDNASEAGLNVGVGMARYFAQNNPHFNKAKFLQACGIQENHEVGQPAYTVKVRDDALEANKARR
jgi:hypothetical protein